MTLLVTILISMYVKRTPNFRSNLSTIDEKLFIPCNKFKSRPGPRTNAIVIRLIESDNQTFSDTTGPDNDVSMQYQAVPLVFSYAEFG